MKDYTDDEIESILWPLLPYSVTVHRRILFHYRSPSSHILLQAQDTIPVEAAATHKQCFAAVFVDRSRRPETECWIFVSGEIPDRCGLSSVSRSCSGCSTAVVELVRRISRLEIPESVHDLHLLDKNNPMLGHAASSNVMLFGAMHEYAFGILRDAGFVAQGYPGPETPYMKYLFPPSALRMKAPTLPGGLQWDNVRRGDFALVRSRTGIPRQDATLALLPSLAIVQKSSERVPIAWGFLGPDGSLTSLHTEEQHRGQGLAKMLVGKLFKDGGYLPDGFEALDTDAGEHWFHADVALDNASSRAVCKSLGGKEGWIAYWIRIDTTSAREEA